MTKEIREIHEKLTLLLPVWEEIADELWRQEYYEANVALTRQMSELGTLLSDIMVQEEYFEGAACDTSQENLYTLLQSMLHTIEKKEYVLLGDILRQSLIPFGYALQEHIVAGELPEIVMPGSELMRGMAVEYTSCGLPTLRVWTARGEFYLHSNRNAKSEANVLVQSWYRPECGRYLVFGMGLGYPVTALLAKSEYCEIEVFEPDATVYEAARQYGEYDEIIASGRVQMTVDADGTEFARAVQRAERELPGQFEVCLFYPAIRLVENTALREKLEDAFINQASERGQYGALYGNFSRNVKNCSQFADELRGAFEGKRVYLVAAGPSLDGNMECLKNVEKDAVIVAAGTVLKKLLRQGIRPDYVVVTDAKAPTFVQVQGVEDCGVPLLGLSTAYFRFFTDYRAPHYLLCQEGFAPAEKLAKERGGMLIQTGGSVITAALSAVLEMGAAQVVFVGLDLAFTGGKDHASGTDFVAEKIEGEQRMVEGVDGKPVATARNLDIYRKFIERLIPEYPGVRFIDATEGGARVNGTELAGLREVVDGKF